MKWGSPWGLARISHREALGLGTFYKYLYNTDGGNGVDVYVVDTGIYTEHADFEDRATWAATIPKDEEDVDEVGHGTTCAGIVAGKRYGVAKRANVHAVKITRSDGRNTVSDIIKGVEFVIESHLSNAAVDGRSKTAFKGSVINLSLGVDESEALITIVDHAVAAGIHVAVAAGNENDDSCNYSPSASTKAITVGASTISDNRADFSNYGNCTDIFAPGVKIMSTSIGSRHNFAIGTGTSMATPHISGLIAYFLSLQPLSGSAFAVGHVSPKRMKDHIVAIASKDKLRGLPDGTKNLLAWNGAGNPEYALIR